MFGLFKPPDAYKLEAKRDIKKLIKALNYKKDGYVHMTAAQALGRLGDPQAVPALIAALDDPHTGTRQAAAESLGKLGDPQAVAALIASLNDRDKNVRKALVDALGKLDDSRAVSPILDMVMDKNRGVSDGVEEVLAKLGRQSVYLLTSALREVEPNVRICAAKALAIINDPRTMDTLVLTLRDSHSQVRAVAAGALEKMGWQPIQDENTSWYWMAKEKWEQCAKGGPLAVDPLLLALQYCASGTETPIIKALGEIGEARAVEPVAKYLSSDKSNARLAAVEALGKIGGARAVQVLVGAVNAKDVAVRKAAIQALGKIGAPQAVEPLIPPLKDADRSVREAAAGSLVMIYQAGALDEAARARILQVRPLIIEPVTNTHNDWTDTPRYSDCGPHTDEYDYKGIGVEFPL